MLDDKNNRFALIMAVVLLVIGLFSYAAFSSKPPQIPLRMMYTGTAGKVLFNHQSHLADHGYAIACMDCHHMLEEDDPASVQSCGECHELTSDDETVPARTDAIHQQCIGCHDEFGAGPTDCSGCHIM